jgi:nicotinamidase/pyrazinamidase
MRTTAVPGYRTHRAAVVVDPQGDFTEGGALAVIGGDEICRRIGTHLVIAAGHYDLVVASADWHVDPGAHFGDVPDFVDTWPRHCVADTPGAGFDPELVTGARVAGGPVDDATQLFDAVVFKGHHEAAYSAAEGTTAHGEGLVELLDAANIAAVTVMGIATSHCVRATVTDLLAAGLAVDVAVDLVVGVTEAMAAEALTAMAAAGARLIATPALVH